MLTYAYIAKSSPEKTIQGEIDAETEQEAISKLAQLGYFPITVAPKISTQAQDSFGLRKISRSDIVLFTRQLSSLIDAGVTVNNGLNIVSGQSANKYLKAILVDVNSKIKDGKSFSDSLALYPQVFPALYSSMIHSGEVGGTLVVTLQRLAEFLEKEEEFRNSLRSALVYPIFIFFVGALTIAVLLGFIIPRLAGMFEDMGQALPLPTQLLINFSSFIQSYWWLILAVLIVIIFSTQRFYRHPQGRLFWDSLKLKMPLWGQIIQKSEISRLTRTLALLISGGIPIIQSLDVAGSVVSNQVLKQEVEKFKDRLKSGGTLSQCLRDSGFFPAFVVNIVSVGEETGNLPKPLMRIASDYETDVDRTLKVITQLLEPVIILVMGLVVGFIVMSMLLPIFQINLLVK